MSDSGREREATQAMSVEPPVVTGIDERVRHLFADPRLLTQLSDTLCVIDRELQFVCISRTLEGRTPAEMLGTNVLDYIPPSFRDAFRAACQRAWSTGAPQSIECPGDGQWWETRMVPIQDERDAPLMFLISALVSERKLREQALSERESRLRDALQASGIGTWTWDRASDQVVWDEGLCRICGIDAKDAPRCYAAYVRHIHPDDRERLEAHVGDGLRTGIYEDSEHRLVRPDGEVRHVFCRAVTVKDELGNVIGLRGGTVDVTDRKRLEEQLRQVQKMEAIGQLTAGIAHNFNNLLSVVLPNVELCRAEAPATMHGRLADIEHAATRATELVRQLLRFARHEIGADKSDVDLTAIAQRTLRFCHATFDRRIAIELVAEPDLPPVLARAVELEQVLLNICINARDALENSHSANPRILIELARASANAVQVSIRDNGPGMDAATRARLFEPFFTTKEVGQGTGLGLASAYGIVVEHGGHISCESAPGAGTMFRVELPIAQRPRSAPPAPIAPPANHGSGTILFIDDEPLVRRALGAVLTLSGFRVLEAEDGSEGLALLRRGDPPVDLVLLDRSMPRMPGEQFLAQLRELEMTLPVVLLTGHPSEVEIPGVEAVLMKPPKTDTLLRTIRQLLDREAAKGP